MILMVFYLESKYGKDWADPVTSTLNYTEDEIAEGIDFIKSLVDGHVMMNLKTYYSCLLYTSGGKGYQHAGGSGNGKACRFRAGRGSGPCGRCLLYTSRCV